MVTKSSYNKESGFTLIELVVVIAILAVLMTMIVPKVTQALKKAQDETSKANRHIIKNALERYYIDNDEYPDSLSKLIEEDYIEIELEENESSKYNYHVGENNQSYTLE